MQEAGFGPDIIQIEDTAPASACDSVVKRDLNLLIATLKLHSNGPSYSNTVIGTLAVDGWAVTFGTVCIFNFLLPLVVNKDVQ